MIKHLLLLLPMVIFAKSYIVSTIPLPKLYIQNLDTKKCDEECLRAYLEQGMIFSFLANAQTPLQDPQLEEARNLNNALLNVDTFLYLPQRDATPEVLVASEGSIKIALLLPYKTIGKYATSTTNAVFAYMMTKNHPFLLKSYKIENESPNELRLALDAIARDGFSYVIAPLTQNGANNLLALKPALHIYLPTINKNDLPTELPTLYFGGIDYRHQSEMLLKYAKSPLFIFSDKSQVAKKITAQQQYLYDTVANGSKRGARTYYLSAKTTNFQDIFKGNSSIKNGSAILNTPVVKSAMIMSQLTLHDVSPSHILSTQINYDPLILSMTQYNDRKNMIVANSITQKNSVLIETNALLGNDILYDWINYTTTVGVDYFYSRLSAQERSYNIELQEQQMVYDVELLKASNSRFVPLLEE